jgi:hypothetical protein
MKSLISATLCFLCVVASAAAARADVIFRVAQTTPASGTNLLNGNASAGVFSIFISSTTANQSLLGVDFFVELSSPGGQGGVLVAGTNDFLTGNVSNPAGWVGDPFAGAGTTSAFYANISLGAAFSIGTSETLLATVTLSTVGAVDGTYSVNLSQVVAADGAFFEIPLSPTSTLSTSYTIAAVPEPTSMALVAVVGLGALVRHRRRAKVC